LQRAGNVSGPADLFPDGADEENDDEYREELKWEIDVPGQG
jgi:hypothetical protein